ncbi:hypothetical protein FRZ67_20500 [Panacibacter ginsenosidivorans]|uniref:DUF4846 domain-containing protein n=1 Tax=Panacibacter ginsenosidivorans TaxID=1813871 RepID=A0A5B8VG72_9BACT|nr:DUF4846 domain-containing protein [Panacibacter ginsenosidivorans]QEC69566.1 hypothetical protein FRZ67_20500 [Panacibacter ginsenosidivorans]
MKQMSIIFFVLLCCCIVLIVVFNDLAELPGVKTTSSAITSNKTSVRPPQYIYEIPLPEGYKRVTMPDASFGAWLQKIKLRKNNTVYLYNGQPKPDQTLHYAVLDFSTGNKDLQQCADAIMRLRAEYYFSRNEYSKINFKSANKNFNFQDWLYRINNPEQDKHNLMLQFMQDVFINCGTYTVDEMTGNIAMKEMQPGDILVKAGSPGHAMVVADVAVNEITGKKIYLLAQGYMPAQDMHIVINPNNKKLSPWYEVDKHSKVITPGWIFEENQLKRWKN